MPTNPTSPNQAPHDPPARKRARRKVTTDLGRQLLTRERQRLAREQAALAEQQAAEAARMRDLKKVNHKAAKPAEAAISRSIVKRFAGVLASEGISVRITATPAAKTSAWTDFEQIVINYRLQDDVREMAANMRGLAYHEGGHCRFTLPFLDLAELAGVHNPDTRLHLPWNLLEDQRMETAVASDSPRKAAYLTTMVLQDLVADVNMAAANWPLLIWRRYLPDRIRAGARKLFVIRHTTKGVTDGETLAQEWERVVNDYVMATDAVTMWNAVIECRNLLDLTHPPAAKLDDAGMGHQRQGQRAPKNLDDYLIIPIDMDMTDTTGGGSAPDAPEPEYDLTDPEVAEHLTEVLIAAWNAPESLIAILYVPNASKGGDDSDDGNGGAGELSDDDQKDGGEQAGSGAEAGDDEGKTFANEKPENDGPMPGGSTGEHKNTGVRDDLDYEGEGMGHGDSDEAGDEAGDEASDDDLTDDDLADALDEAEAKRNADHQLDQDVQSFQEAINDRVSELLPYNPGRSDNAEAHAAADNLAQDIEQAFQEATVDLAPGWVEGQRRGIVNVLRYQTRRPGDVEFFRQYTDTENPGFNISVSVLLDYSASMGGATLELAQAGYACKKACESLDIPCSVILWDTSAKVLWDATEQAEFLPVIVAVGGTDPSYAVADLDNQRYDKDVHIVIIMTDGQWGGSAAQPGFLASYKGDRPGRYFVGLGYNSGWGDSGEGMATNLRRYGCDEAHKVENLMEIPRHLEQMLISFA